MANSTITVLRSSDNETTFATVNVETTESMNHMEILNAVRGAVTEWVDTTEEGTVAFDESCQDFNIGDLASHMDDYELGIMLRERGIIEMEIEITSIDNSVSNDWIFDTLLYKSNTKEV